MIHVLEIQRNTIAHELTRLEEAKAALPPLIPGEWLGPAHSAYLVWLAKVHHDAEAVIDRMRVALSDARQAVETAGGW